jgi:hypothetical protein
MDNPSGQRAERTAVTETAPEPGWGEAVGGPANEVPALTRPAYRLASPGQIGLAGFLGGPLAGFLLMGRNYAKCGRSAACWASVGVGVLVTVAAVSTGIVLSESSRGLNLLIGVPLWIGTYLTAKALHERSFQEHRNQGGEQASGGVVLGFTALGVVLTVGGAFGGGALYEFSFGDRQLQVTAMEEIYYGPEISEAEARTLGRVLQQQGFFNGVREKSVGLHKDGQDYILAVILGSGFNDPQLHQEIRVLAGEVSRALGGKPVRVELCDEWWTPKKKLPAERQP